MEIPTEQDLDHLVEPIREIEERQIYEQIKSSDITAMIIEILTDNDVDIDIAIEIINMMHWSLQRCETKRIERILDSNIYEMKQRLIEAKKKPIIKKEVLKQ